MRNYHIANNVASQYKCVSISFTHSDFRMQNSLCTYEKNIGMGLENYERALVIFICLSLHVIIL